MESLALDTPHAAGVLSHAAQQVENVASRSDTMLAVADEQLHQGDADGALATVDKIEKLQHRSLGLQRVAQADARRGKPERMLQRAERSKEPMERARIYLGIAEGMLPPTRLPKDRWMKD